MKYSRKVLTLSILATVLLIPLSVAFGNVGGSNNYASANDCSGGIKPASITYIDHSFSTNTSTYSLQLNSNAFDTAGNAFWTQMTAQVSGSGMGSTIIFILSVRDSSGVYHTSSSNSYSHTLGVGYQFELTLTYSGQAIEGGGVLLDSSSNVLFSDTSLSWSVPTYNIYGYTGAYSGVYGENSGTPHVGFSPSGTQLFHVQLFLHDSYTYAWNSVANVTCWGPVAYGASNLATAESSNLAYSGITQYSNEIDYAFTT